MIIFSNNEISVNAPSQQARETTNSSLDVGNSPRSSILSSVVPEGSTNGVLEVGYTSTSFTRPTAGTNELPIQPDSVIQLNSNNNNYRAIDRKGFSQQRPEILASIEFESAFDEVNANTVSPVGEMLDIQISARKLQAENVIRLINELSKNKKTSEIISQIRNDINSLNDNAEIEVNFLTNIIQNLANLRKSFDIKLNEDSIKKRVIDERSRFGARQNRFNSINPPKGVSEILVQDLKFSSSGIKGFTNTKILAQLINDLRVIISSYSPKIFDLPNLRRESDNDPIKINKLDSIINGSAISFDISSIASRTETDVINGAKKRSIDSFLSGLSSITNPDDRIKLLYTILSKELRVSSGLSLRGVKDTLRNIFNSPNTGDIFQSVFGVFGDDILQPTNSPSINSIANLLRIETADGNIILPFESIKIHRYLSSYIPGRDFYINSILQGVEKFNTDPVKNFSQVFSNRVNAAAYLIEAMLDVDAINSSRKGINAKDIYWQINSILKQFVQYATPSHTSTATRDEFTMAVLTAANRDSELKHLIFLKMLIDGYFDKYSPNTTDGEHSFYDSLESIGLTADIIINEILDQGDAAYSRTLPITGPNAAQLNSGDRVRRSQVSSLRTESRQNPVIERIIPAQEIIGDLIVRQIIRQQSFYVETVFPVTTVPGTSTTINTGNNTGFINPHDRLISDSWARGKMSSISTIFRGINSVLNSIDSIARDGITGTAANQNTKGYYDEANCELTKFNGVGAHTLALIVLEIAVNTISKLNFANFAGLRTDNLPFIDIVVRLNDNLVEVAYAVLETQDSDVAISNAIDPFLRDIFRRSKSEFSAIQASLIDDDDLIRDITEILRVIGTIMKERADETSVFFNLNNGPNKEILNTLSNTNDFNDKFSALDIAQVILARINLREQKIAKQSASYMNVFNNDIALIESSTPFIDDSMILPSVRNALFSMLRNPEFLPDKGKNAQILSVGLPAGFTNVLQDRLSNYILGQDLSEFERRRGLQNDIIKINVYMQDLLFDELVFKPKSFIFETGRFVTNKDFDLVLDSNINFSSMLETQITTQAISVDGTKFISNKGFHNDSAIISDSSYGFLSDNEKYELIENHVKSYLLNIYIKLLTGADMNEDSFLINDEISGMLLDQQTREKFESLITTHISQFLNRQISLDELRTLSPDIDNLLSRLSDDEITKGIVNTLNAKFSDVSDSENIEISQDLITFMKTFSKSSIIFGAGTRRERLTSPKMFERIFHILVDPDDFEIDEEQTAMTAAGQSVLSSNSFLDQTIENPVNLIDRTKKIQQARKIDLQRRRQLGQTTLLQFFVTVEQLPELIELTSNTIPAVRRLSPQVVRQTHDLLSELTNINQTTTNGELELNRVQDTINSNKSTSTLRTSNDIARTNSPNSGISMREII